MVIILTSYLVFALVIGIIMTSYSQNTNMRAVGEAAEVIKAAVEDAYESSDFDDFNQYVFYSSDALERLIGIMPNFYKGITVVIADKSGNILLSDNTGNAELHGNAISDEILKSFGQDMRFRGSTTLSGAFEEKRTVGGEKLIDEVKGCYGYVFVCLINTETSGFVRGILKTLGIVAIWTLAATLFAVFFISERIMSPLRNISAATKSFAQGHFDVRIPVEGNDEIAELATAFNNMAVTLQNNEKTRSAFLGNISHDLRTPMTTISGFVDGMLDGAIPPEKYEHYLRIVSSETKRLSRLVSTLLDITKIQAGERKFQKTEFDICETARQIIISCEQRLNEKHLDVVFECAEDNMLVFADTDAVYQVLYNICDNAIKFSKEGGIYRVSIVRNLDKVFVSVFNEGEGIKPEELPFVFERFYKSDKSRGLDKTGLGLGLYICKTIIDAQGEEIWVKSEYGKNCEFVFTLQSALKGEKAL